MNLFVHEFRLPFEGRWFVIAGGDTRNVNHHMAIRAQWYAVDFCKVGGPSQRALTRTGGKTIQDFYSWEENVLSPTEGEVISVADGLPDNPLGKRDVKHPAGHH